MCATCCYKVVENPLFVDVRYKPLQDGVFRMMGTLVERYQLGSNEFSVKIVQVIKLGCLIIVFTIHTNYILQINPVILKFSRVLLYTSLTTIMVYVLTLSDLCLYVVRVHVNSIMSDGCTYGHHL